MADWELAETFFVLVNSTARLRNRAAEIAISRSVGFLGYSEEGEARRAGARRLFGDPCRVFNCRIVSFASITTRARRSIRLPCVVMGLAAALATLVTRLHDSGVPRRRVEGAVGIEVAFTKLCDL